MNPAMNPTPNAQHIALQGLVKGVVQGVFFRASTRDKAIELGVGGWVRNTPDGHVEVCLSGDELQVGKMVLWLYEGPPRARVSEVNLAPVDSPPITGFEIRR